MTRLKGGRLLRMGTGALALFTVSAAAQDWQEYRVPEYGFAVHFPGQPKIEDTQYKTKDGVSVAERVFSVTQDASDYRVSVADFTGANIDGDKAIGDATDKLRSLGNVLVDLPARVNREYGRQLSLTEANGRRVVAAIFFVNHRLFQVEGSVVSADANTADAMRFQQSLNFAGAGSGGRGFRRGRF
jgi:hypothetical protein